MMNTEQAIPRPQSDELGEWLRRFIDSYRAGYGALSQDERQHVFSIDAVNAPTQIEAIWFGPPDVQYLLVTHFGDLNDLEISVDGPFPTYEAVARLQKVLEKPKWNQPIDTDVETRWSLLNPKNFGEVVEDVCVEIVRDLGRLPFLRPSERPMIAAKTLLTSNASMWYVMGNLVKSSPQALATEIIDGTKMHAEFARKAGQPASLTQPVPRIQAHGGFIFPPVWIGKAPKPTFVQRLSSMPLFPVKAYEGTYKNKLLIVDQDGFLAIAESDRLKAAVFLNEIMAVRLLAGKPTFALREHEVIETQIDLGENRITSKGVPSLSPRASMMDEWLREPRHIVPREVVSNEELEEWLRRAEKITDSGALSETLRFLLEAYTHFENSDYLEAFVLSWLIVEKDVYSRWNRYLEEKRLEASRRRKLENPSVWTVDVVIEELSLAGVISEDDYRKLMAMKTVRNNMIHRAERVSKEQADQLLKLALGIIGRGASETHSPRSENSKTTSSSPERR